MLINGFKRSLRVRFFGKIQIRILVSKNGFCVSLPKSENGLIGISDLKNPHSEWIHQIKSKSGFLGFMFCAFLWGAGSENSTSVKRSSKQIYWSRHIFSRSRVTEHSIVEKKIQGIIPFRIFEKFSPKEQTDSFVYHFCNSGTRLC